MSQILPIPRLAKTKCQCVYKILISFVYMYFKFLELFIRLHKASEQKSLGSTYAKILP